MAAAAAAAGVHLLVIIDVVSCQITSQNVDHCSHGLLSWLWCLIVLRLNPHEPVTALMPEQICVCACVCAMYVFACWSWVCMYVFACLPLLLDLPLLTRAKFLFYELNFNLISWCSWLIDASEASIVHLLPTTTRLC